MRAPAGTKIGEKKGNKKVKNMTQGVDHGDDGSSMTSPASEPRKRQKTVQFSSPLSASRGPAGAKYQSSTIGETDDDATITEPATPTPGTNTRYSVLDEGDDLPEVETRTRVYSPPAGYIPPSLPMLDPNASPKAPKQKEVPKEDPQPDPTQPCPSNPDLPTFMCCDGLDIQEHMINVDSSDAVILRQLFFMAGGFYPVSEIMVDRISTNWSTSILYVVVIEEDIPGPYDPNNTKFYAVVNLIDGHLIKMTPVGAALPRPEIMGTTDAAFTTKERFVRLQGGGMDFQCGGHGKKFITYFVNYLEEGQVLRSQYNDDEYVRQGRQRLGLRGDGTDSQGMNI
ncbi:hypothetical protein EG329_012435 [Mollisiaceae sp. DMI_Dod_QoI]|nr:hypothetical protein EG329_012435 [Helotiales sp. DMI_Dod_QoI]